jgi:hypothetical protein
MGEVEVLNVYLFDFFIQTGVNLLTSGAACSAIQKLFVSFTARIREGDVARFG